MYTTESQLASVAQQQKIIALLNDPRATYSEKQAVQAQLPTMSASEAEATYATWLTELSQRPQFSYRRYRRAA